MKKILETLIVVILASFLILIILLQPGINAFPYSIFSVSSGSMEPVININDLVLIKKNTSYETGDIVVYKKNNEYIVHRIISMNKDNVITQGDANNKSDEPITKDDILGVYILKFSRLAELINFINKYYFVLVTIFAGLVIFMFIKE